MVFVVAETYNDGSGSVFQDGSEAIAFARSTGQHNERLFGAADSKDGKQRINIL